DVQVPTRVRNAQLIGALRPDAYQPASRVDQSCATPDAADGGVGQGVSLDQKGPIGLPHDQRIDGVWNTFLVGHPLLYHDSSLFDLHPRSLQSSFLSLLLYHRLYIFVKYLFDISHTYTRWLYPILILLSRNP